MTKKQDEKSIAKYGKFTNISLDTEISTKKISKMTNNKYDELSKQADENIMRSNLLDSETHK